MKELKFLQKKNSVKEKNVNNKWVHLCRNEIGDTEFGEKEIQNNTRNSSKKYEIEKNKITGEIKKKKKYKIKKGDIHDM